MDVSSKEEMEKVAKKYDLMALSWPAVPDQGIQAGHGTAGLVLEYKGEAMAPAFDLGG